MFSSNELISFVFANENDTYYRDDLLKLNQDQHLWYLLHENFDAVYFLTNKNGLIQAHSFGDQKGKVCPVFKPGLFKGAEEKTSSWLLDRLQERSALVCSLEDFCEVFSHKQWRETLERIAEDKKRSGILVLTASATAEDTTELLLTSPVFEYLHETAVTSQRSGSLRDLYSAICDRKFGNCLFLNTFTWEGIHALLLHVVMAYPQRINGLRLLDQLTDYLHAYLNEPELFSEEPLLDPQISTEHLTYHELYTHLCKEWIWNRLEKRSQQYMRGRVKENSVPILRDINSYAGRCKHLALPSWLRANPDVRDQLQEELKQLRADVSSPKNRMENPEIVSAAEHFLSQLDAVYQDDWETYSLSFNALMFCVDWIYAETNDAHTAELKDLIASYRAAVSLSDSRFKIRRELQQFVIKAPESKLTQKTIEQIGADLYIKDEQQQKYADLIAARKLMLKASADAPNLAEVIEQLEKEITAFDEQPVAKPNPIDPPEEQPATDEEASDDTVTLRPSDWNYIPI